MKKYKANRLLDTDVSNDHFSGEDNITSITGTASDIIDFRTDGKVYTNIQCQADTTTYVIAGDSKITINGDQDYDITRLTSNSFILHEKVNASGTDFYEETLTLKK